MQEFEIAQGVAAGEDHKYTFWREWRRGLKGMARPFLAGFVAIPGARSTLGCS